MDEAGDSRCEGKKPYRLREAEVLPVGLAGCAEMLSGTF
jgi:hypothetical protein